MDTKPVEAALTEVGKAFRLSRLYPPTHPSVQQALSELAATLPAVASLGVLELRIAQSAFMVGATPLATRNPQLREFASLLYGQGYRALVIEPGVTAEEFGALARMAAGAGARNAQSLGAQTRVQPLPHLKLEQAARKTSGPARTSGTFAAPESAPLGRRSMMEFRPDALPPEIEASRLIAMLEVAAPAEAPRHLGRLAELSPEVMAHRDFGVFAKAMAALAQWARSDDPERAPAAQAAQQGLDRSVTQAGLAALVARLSDPHVPAAERDGIAHALGALGARAVAPVVEAFGAASPEHRDMLLAIVRLSGEAAVPVITARLDQDVRGEHARGLALMLGATRHPTSSSPLMTLARHAEAAVRAAAIAGLARLAQPDAERLVVGALRDGDVQVRIAGARGIVWFGDASVVPILLAHLANEVDVDVVRALAATLGELRDPRAVHSLTELARGVSGVFQRHPPAVRASAVRALAAIGTEEAMAVVASFRTDRHSEIRQAADEAFEAS